MSGLSLQDLGVRAVEEARRLGAVEATARVSRGVWADVGWRDGRAEKCQESHSLTLRVSLLVDDRYSSHSTNDLRPESLTAFLGRAVDATRVLEPDPDRRLPDRALMGIAEPAALDQLDPGARPQPHSRRELAAVVEAAARSLAADAPLRSAGASVWDGHSETCMVTSHGFAGGWRSTQYGLAAEVSLIDADGRLPEAGAYCSARYRADLPEPAIVASEAVERAKRRLGSRPARSGRYPMLVESSRVPRVMGLLLTPLAGQTLYEGRSCLSEKLGERLVPGGLTLRDDPLLPRGLGSRAFDHDGLRATPRFILENGVLASFLLDVYHARRLGRAPTTGQTSNLIIPAGARSPEQIAADLPQCIRVEGFLGGNSNPATGSFSFGVYGTLLAHGEPVQRVSEMNVSGSLLDLLASWVESANDPWPWGSWRTPSLLFDGVQFSGS